MCKLNCLGGSGLALALALVLALGLVLVQACSANRTGDICLNPTGETFTMK